MNLAVGTVSRAAFRALGGSLPRGTETWIGGSIFAALVVAGIVGPNVYTVDPKAADLSSRFAPPFTSSYPLGADELGRDMLAQILHGLRWSLGISLLATLIAVVIGAGVGVLAGFGPPLVARMCARLIDFGIAFPGLVVAVSVLAVVGQGFFQLAFTLGFIGWPLFSRVIHAETLSLGTREFVIAARTMGVSRTRIIWWHILPGVRSTVLVVTAFAYADLLLAEAGLSFIGLGAPLTASAWGNMLASGQPYLASHPWLVFVPGLVIVTAVIAVNMVGEGLAKRAGRAV